MNENDLILQELKFQIMQLTYFEYINTWSKQDHSKRIETLKISIQQICDVMNIIGSSKFWIHEKGICGWGDVYVDVRKEFGLFSCQKQGMKFEKVVDGKCND